MGYDVFGMCNPLYDIQAEVGEELLAQIGVEKGGMFLIDADQQAALIAQIEQLVVNAEAGGSGANTMIGISLLGGEACYAGKVGNDENGKLYRHGLKARRVTSTVAAGEGVTGMSVILVTPDAERTMCTHLGICRELGPEDVPVDAIRDSKYLYVTGYLWDTDSQKAAVLKAMQTARDAGVKVALSLSDPFCVDRHREDFLRITRDHVDLLIGNETEAQALTGISDTREAICAMSDLCDMAAITMDVRGSLLREGNRVIEVAACPVAAVDTTGAGDMYAAGLLYGLTHGLTLETTGRLAAYVAAEVVARMGPRLPDLDESAVRRILND